MATFVPVRKPPPCTQMTARRFFAVSPAGVNTSSLRSTGAPVTRSGAVAYLTFCVVDTCGNTRSTYRLGLPPPGGGMHATVATATTPTRINRLRRIAPPWMAVIRGSVAAILSLSVVLSGADGTFSKTDKTMSVADKTFSTADKTLSAADKTLSVTDKVMNAANKTFPVKHVADQGAAGAEAGSVARARDLGCRHYLVQ